MRNGYGAMRILTGWRRGTACPLYRWVIRTSRWESNCGYCLWLRWRRNTYHTGLWVIVVVNITLFAVWTLEEGESIFCDNGCIVYRVLLIAPTKASHHLNTTATARIIREKCSCVALDLVKDARNRKGNSKTPTCQITRPFVCGIFNRNFLFLLAWICLYAGNTRGKGPFHTCFILIL